MRSGVEQQIGIGQAQVLPEAGRGLNAFVENLSRQKRYKDEKDRYDKNLKYQQEKDLFGIVGDALNLRDFNPIIHDKVRKAKSELAARLSKDQPSLGEAHLQAQNYAQELGAVSDQLNQVDKIIAASKEEYKGDKRLNLANIEKLARREVLDELNATGKVDTSVNPFDKALNKYPQFARTDNGDYTLVDFKNARKQDLTGKFKEKTREGKVDQFDWKTEYYPDLYDFKDNGEEKAPEITTKAGESFDGMPMLEDRAYGFWATIPSNVVTVNERLQKKYPDLDLGSSDAEKLRKVEAFKEVENQKPKINKSRVAEAAPERSFSFKFGSGGAPTPESQINRPYKRIKELVRSQKSKGQAFTPAILLEEDDGKIVLDAVKQRMTAKEAAKVTLNDYKLIEGDDGSIRIFDKNTDDFVAFIGETSADFDEQPGVKEKRERVGEINKGNKQTGNRPPLSEFVKPK